MRVVLWMAMASALAGPASAEPTSHVVGVHDYRAVVGGLAQGGLTGPKPWAVIGTTGRADWRCAKLKLGTLCAVVSKGIIVSVQRWCPTQEKGWDEGCTLWNEAAKACPSRPSAVQVRLNSDRLIEVPGGQEADCGEGVVVGHVVLSEPGLTGLLTGWSLAEESSFALTFLNQHIPGDYGPRLEPLPPGVAAKVSVRQLAHVPAGHPKAPVVTGPMPEGEVMRVFQARKRAIAACVPASAKGVAPKRVLVDFAIEADGTVSSAVIRASDLDNAQVERCLVEEITGMGFVKPEGEGQVRVSYAVPVGG